MYTYFIHVWMCVHDSFGILFIFIIPFALFLQSKVLRTYIISQIFCNGIIVYAYILTTHLKRRKHRNKEADSRKYF